MRCKSWDNLRTIVELDEVSFETESETDFVCIFAGEKKEIGEINRVLILVLHRSHRCLGELNGTAL